MRSIILSALLCLTQQFLYSQQITYTVVPTSVETCSDTPTQFEVTINNTSSNPITDGQLSINVDPDAIIESTSVLVNQTLPNLVTTTNPIIIPAAGIYVFTYSVSYPCEMNPVTGTGIAYEVTDMANFTFNNTTISTSEDYFVDYANLISNSSSNPLSNMIAYGHPGSIIQRSINVVNTGTVAFDGVIRFEDILNCESAVNILSIDIIYEDNFGVQTTLATYPIGSFIAEVDLATFSVSLPDMAPGNVHQIIFKETLEVVGCLDENPLLNECIGNTAKSEFLISWGCTNTNLCKQVSNALNGNSNYTATIQRDNAAPFVIHYRSLPADGPDNIPFENICLNPISALASPLTPSQFTEREYVFVNEGTSPAHNIVLNLDDNNSGSDLTSNDLIFENNIHLEDQFGNIILPSEVVYAPAIYEQANQNECVKEAAIQGLNPITRIAWEIPLLNPDAYFKVVYKIFRCCPESDTSYFTSEPAPFDVWVLNANPGYYYDDECTAATSSTAPQANIIGSTQVDVDLQPDPTLFRTHHEKGTFLNASQEILTPTSDLAGLTGTCNLAGTEEFEILMDGFNDYYYNGVNTAGIAQFFSPSLSAPPTAQLKLEIIMEQGLTIDPLNYPTLELQNGLTIWDHNGPVVSGIVGDPSTSLTMIFDPTDPSVNFSNYAELRTFMLNSILRLKLTPCCPSLNDGPANFKVQWSVNPTGTGCTDCWIPLSGVEREMQVHCPGCVTPGIITESLTTKRTNFGWPDENNNGLVDSGASQIQVETGLFFQSNKYKSMPGDVLTTEISSFFVDGDPTGGIGFSYDQWRTQWGNMDYLYVDLNTPCIGAFDLDVISIEMQITNALTGQTTPPFNVSSYLTSTSVSNFLVLNINDLIANQGVPAGWVYNVGDYYTFKIFHRICGNDDTALDVTECDINARIWLAGVGDMTPTAWNDEAQAAEVNYNLPAGTNPTDRVLAIDGDHIFLCEAFATKHKICRLYRDISSNWSNVGFVDGMVSCTKHLVNQVSVSLGGAMSVPGLEQDRKNFFPYEYRPINHDFLSFGFETPPGYVYSDSKVNSWFPVYTPGGTMYRRIVNGDNVSGVVGTGTSTPFLYDLGPINYQFASEDLILDNGFPIDASSPTSTSEVDNSYLIYGDEKWLQRLSIYFEPDPNCPPASVVLTDVEAISSLATPLCNEPIINEVVASTYNLIAPTPQIDFVTTSVLPIVTNPGIMTFTIDHNQALGHLAEYMYVKLVPPAGVTINTITLNGVIVPAGLIPLGTSLNFSNFDFVVDFTVNDCALSQIIWPIQYGHGCNEYPATLNDVGCVENTETISIPLESVAIYGSGTQDNSVSLCEVAHYSGCFSSTQNGNVGDFYFAIELPNGAAISGSPIATGPGGASFSPVFVSNTGNIYNYSLDPSWNLVNLVDQICIDFDVLYAGDCYNYGSEAPTLTLSGIPYCQSPIVSYAVQYAPLQIIGSSCTPLVISSVVQDVLCAVEGAIDLSVTGQPTLSYSWSNGVTAQDQTNLLPGSYTVTVTDGYNCSNSQTFTIVDATPNLTQPADITQCDSYTLPSLSVGNYFTGPGGSGSMLAAGSSITASQTIYIYAETGTNPNCTDEVSFLVNITPFEVISHLPMIECDQYVIPLGVGAGTVITTSGIYTYYSGFPHCTEEIWDITINPSPLISNILVTPVTCFGGADGTVSISATGTAPFVYEIQDGSNITNSDGEFGSLVAGQYSVLVTDNVGCSVEVQFVVPGPSAPLSVSGIVTHSCASGPSYYGSIDIAITGGSGPYNYQWSSGSQTQDINSLAPGNYTVTVTDANGCSITQTYKVINLSPHASVLGCFSVNQNDCAYTFENLFYDATSSVPGLVSTAQWTIVEDGSGNPPTVIGNTWDISNFTFPTSGHYIVCVTITNTLDGQSCSEECCLVVKDVCTINCEEAIQANFNFNFSIGNGLSCSNTSTSSGGTPTGNVIWNWGDGSSDSYPYTPGIQPLYGHVYGNPGFYEVCMTVYYEFAGGLICSETVCQTVTVCDENSNENCANVNFGSIQQLGGYNVAFNSFVTPSNFTVLSYQWYFGLPGAFGTGANPNYTYPPVIGTQLDSYTVTLIVTGIDAEGNKCIVCESKTINVKKVKKSMMIIQPNPSSGKVAIHSSLDIDEEIIIEIDNSSGINVYRAKHRYSENIPLDLSLYGLEEGVYFVRMMNSNETLIEKMIIIH